MIHQLHVTPGAHHTPCHLVTSSPPPISNPQFVPVVKSLSRFTSSVFFIIKDFMYLFMRNTQREVETEAEGEAGSLQRAQSGTGS